MTILWKKNTLLKADCFINSKLYHIFAIFSTAFSTTSIRYSVSFFNITPMRACVAPVCDFKSEVEELPMIDFLGLVGEMWKKILLENKKNIRVENSAG